jgi:hypothetical protein
VPATAAALSAAPCGVWVAATAPAALTAASAAYAFAYPNGTFDGGAVGASATVCFAVGQAAAAAPADTWALTPAGVTVNNAAGQYYNPYFAGGKIGMPKQLIDGAVDYPDGTPATESQMAKDVAVFLAWAAEPDQGALLGFCTALPPSHAFLLLRTHLTPFRLPARKMNRHSQGVWPQVVRGRCGCSGPVGLLQALPLEPPQGAQDLLPWGIERFSIERVQTHFLVGRHALRHEPVRGLTCAAAAAFAACPSSCRP